MYPLSMHPTLQQHFSSMFMPDNLSCGDSRSSETDASGGRAADFVRIVQAMVYNVFALLEQILEAAEKEENESAEPNQGDDDNASQVIIKSRELIERLYQATRDLHPFHDIPIAPIFG
ncbi:hypothetical protein BCV70DRAFT_201096 [Testicularia cyperi]|uniref:Uncharacterized protein n=1 Tax=Testicularia cyperi TaxID=1882483 RepID=A0A317XMJ5_9BASI|nr:hypothetical protein BCV70DRAFT_201096 [Testicularia cyperi]